MILGRSNDGNSKLYSGVRDDSVFVDLRILDLSLKQAIAPVDRAIWDRLLGAADGFVHFQNLASLQEGVGSLQETVAHSRK